MGNRSGDEENSDGSESNTAASDGDRPEDGQSDSAHDGPDTTLPSGSDRDRRRHSTRNKEQADASSGITLEGMITFFTYGSGVLLALIIGFFIYNQLVGTSSTGEETSSDHSPSERESVSVSTAEDTSIQSVEEDEIDLKTEAGRREINDAVERSIREIRDLDSFRSRHAAHLQDIQEYIRTMIDHISTVSDTGSTDADLKERADQASSEAEQLMQELLNAYDGNEQVKSKIKTLNYKVLWEVQEQRDKITGGQR